MIDLKALTRIAKAVVADMGSDRLCATTQHSICNLEAVPEHVFGLVDLMAKEGRKKRPSDPLIGGYAFLLAHGLERLRYKVDCNDAATLTLVDRLRQHLIAGGEAGRITPAILLLVLHQFSGAKLEIGDDLRALMQTLMEKDSEARAAVERGAGADHFARMVEQFGGDPFAIHANLDEILDAMPEDARASMVMATFAEREPALREAAIGFLLNTSPEVRGKLIDLLERVSPHGLVSPTMFRRMIALRNWLPAGDRTGLDQAIKSARKAAIACAPWPRSVVRQVLSSGVDGSGAFTVLAIAEEAGKPFVAGLLVKQGCGVRDAWVRRNVSNAELQDIVGQIASEIDLAETSLDYIKVVCCHALAINLETGHLAPFGLLDCAEVIGLADLNPEVLPVDMLVADLIAEVEEKRLTAAAVSRTLRQSAGWLDEHSTLQTWFEDDANIARAIGTHRAPRNKQMAVLLAGPMQARRRRWAELAAWMALALKHRREAADWQGFAIVARELLATRPLDEIGLMRAIADTTLAVMALQGLLGSRRAA
jgi:hypothetical protein